MALQGDLSTLDLADLLQNLEQHGRTGMLTVEGERRSTQLFFEEGQLTLLAWPDRPGLMDVLVASGRIVQDDLEAVRKKRRRSKKSLGEVLVASKLTTDEELVGIAHARLLDEACELVASKAEAFTFTEGAVPRGVFDPEERRLGIRLPAGPLLMESARREDHWALIRNRIPSDSAHYIVQRGLRPADDAPELLPLVVELCDGTRSVSEVMASFPHQRFEAYQLLSDLAESRSVRVAEPADLVNLARDLARHDSARAWRVVGRGLEANPQHLDLLTERVALAEGLEELEAASEALKMLVHLRLEAGDTEAARAELERLKELDPTDTSVWERSLTLNIDAGRLDDARADGLRLAELYRGPGLHKKAVQVFETLLAGEPNDFELHSELARSRVDCGELTRACAGLVRFGKGLLGDEDYRGACRVFEELLALDPSNEEAQDTLEMIRSGALAEKRARRRRLVRRLAAVVGLSVMLSVLVYEGAARKEYADAQRLVLRQGLIEGGQYADAAELLDSVRSSFPYSATAWFDVRRQVADLRQRAEER